jgi:hypothetical protein
MSCHSDFRSIAPAVDLLCEPQGGLSNCWCAAQGTVLHCVCGQVSMVLPFPAKPAAQHV